MSIFSFRTCRNRRGVGKGEGKEVTNIYAFLSPQSLRRISPVTIVIPMAKRVCPPSGPPYESHQKGADIGAGRGREDTTGTRKARRPSYYQSRTGFSLAKRQYKVGVVWSSQDDAGTCCN